MDGQAERAAVIGVERIFGEEFATDGEFDQFAGLIGVGILAVAVGYEQLAVGGNGQVERPVQVNGILIDESSAAGGVADAAGMGITQIDSSTSEAT